MEPVINQDCAGAQRFDDIIDISQHSLISPASGYDIMITGYDKTVSPSHSISTLKVKRLFGHTVEYSVIGPDPRFTKLS